MSACLLRLALLCVALACLPAGPAYAATPSPPDQIAAGWRTDPVWMDPGLRPAFPPAELDRIRASTKGAPFPVYVALLPDTPYVRGVGSDLPTLLHARVGKPGLYVVSSVSGSSWYGRAELFRPAGLKGRDLRRVQLDDKQDNDLVTNRPAPEIARTVQQALTAYDGRPLPQIPAADLEEPYVQSEERSTTDKENLSAYLGMVAGGLVGFVLVIVLVLRRRARGPRPVAGPGAAMSVKRLRKLADERLVKADRALQSLEKLSGPTVAQLDRRDDLRTRLDAARALRKNGPDDALGLAGAFVLARQAAQLGKDEHADPPCFFDPTHPAGVQVAPWSDDTEVPACVACAKTVARGRTPRGFHVSKRAGLFGRGRRTVPYWTLDPADSPMVATGFGALSDDLARRVGQLDGAGR